MTAPTIIVHWLEDSRSQRILWLLEELELTYEVKKYKRDPKTNLAMDDLKQVHPLGKSPVVEFQEGGKTIKLAESGAIVEYIIEKYGNGKLSIGPTEDPEARAKYLYWLHWAEGSGMGPLIMSIVFAQMPKQAPFIVRPLVSTIASQVMTIYVRPKLRENFNFVENELKGKEFFVGDKLTGADIMMEFPAEGLETALGYEKYPTIKQWFDRMEARPAYKRALERGGANDMGRFVR